MSSTPADLDIFQENRSLLFGIAYRMLGSVSEAEDMVQETFVRWQRQSSGEIRSARAWLTATITRLCIDELRSARKRREEYVGLWLPEPLVEKPADASHKTAALADSLSTAFLVLLETLSPAERAAFLLREVFEYDYEEIARIMEKNEANCRQMVRRARDHVAARQARFDPNLAQNEKLVEQFLNACSEGDTEGLLSMLTEDATIYSDGGGKVAAAPRPIVGDKAVARFLIGVSKLYPAGREARFAAINSSPGVLLSIQGALIQTMALDIVDGRVRALYIVRNPEKLRHLATQGSVPNGES